MGEQIEQLCEREARGRIFFAHIHGKGFSTLLRDLKWLFVWSLQTLFAAIHSVFTVSSKVLQNISILLLRLLCSKSYTRNLGGAVLPHRYLWGSNCSPCSAAPANADVDSNAAI